MKRRILLVDDEVAILLTLKAVLEISGFDVETAASAREAKTKLRTRSYEMVITDMRMESDEAGREVILAARTAAYHPAVALLTAFPVSEDDWQDMGADKMLVKPMQVPVLIKQLEKLLETHVAKLKKLESGGVAAGLAAGFAAGLAAGKAGTANEAAAAKATGANRRSPQSAKLPKRSSANGTEPKSKVPAKSSSKAKPVVKSKPATRKTK